MSLPTSSSRRRTVKSSRFAPLNDYPVRIMLGLIASLSVLVLCFRLPVQSSPVGVGWGPDASEPLITRKDVREMEGGTPSETHRQPGSPVTSFDAVEDEIASSDQEGAHAARPGNDTPSDEEASEEEPTPRPGLSEAVQLHLLDEKPRAIGGIGGVYLKIDYPRAARRDSIQGRLLLRFVVEEDGSTSHVQVARSLHPLCDSAAVQAVQRTRFVPGRRNGEIVRVAMQLPIRFKLLPQRTSLQAARSSSDEMSPRR